jgi:hypothetical protein
MMMGRRARLMSTLANIMKATSQTQETIAQNLK